jgi:hypothetical protein
MQGWTLDLTHSLDSVHQHEYSQKSSAKFKEWPVQPREISCPKVKMCFQGSQ